MSGPPVRAIRQRSGERCSRHQATSWSTHGDAAASGRREEHEGLRRGQRLDDRRPQLRRGRQRRLVAEDAQRAPPVPRLGQRLQPGLQRGRELVVSRVAVGDERVVAARPWRRRHGATLPCGAPCARFFSFSPSSPSRHSRPPPAPPRAPARSPIPPTASAACRTDGQSCKAAFRVAKRTNSVKCFLNGNTCTHTYRGRSWTCRLRGGERVTCRSSGGRVVKYRLG